MNLLSNIHYNLEEAERLVASINNFGHGSKMSWIHKKASKGLFYGVTPENATEYCLIMDSYLTILNARFPDRWEVKYEVVDDSPLKLSPKIVIHYPKFTISNSVDETHEIKDLFVVLELVRGTSTTGQTTIYIEDIKGIRSTYTDKEIANGYVHSHLHSKGFNNDYYTDYFTADSFCLGQGEIKDTMMLMQTHSNIDLFEMFLLNLDTMVAWESIEGKPYKRMKKIAEGTPGNPPDDDICNILYTVLINKLIRREVELNYIMQNNRYNIKRDSKLNNVIKEILFDESNDLKSYWTNYLVTRTIDGQLLYLSKDKRGFTPLFIQASSLPYSKVDEVPYILFRGKKFELTVIKTHGIDPRAYDVSPILINYVAKELEQYLYGKAVRKSAITAESRLSAV